ncbi:uncharacterized protein LTR77_007327 [Saxophila tyrrhenica]|uniref:Uncharacterized protein n=1 Tax=Saxophila tyrrhenica TaxID=1690608 RepID=A0AAV9P544_9PEZI|nr:hypothetical protein LTR77_007327 [Saxophila tyrrhenica]
MAMGSLYTDNSRKTLSSRKSGKPNSWSRYMKGASWVFAQQACYNRHAIVLTNAPPDVYSKRVHSSYREIEEPILRGCEAGRHTIQINYVHPAVPGAACFRYQTWPNNRSSEWFSFLECIAIKDIVKKIVQRTNLRRFEKVKELENVTPPYIESEKSISPATVCEGRKQETAQEKKVAKQLKVKREQQAARDKKAAKQLKAERKQQAAQQAAQQATQEQRAAKGLKAEREQQAARDKKAAKQFKAERKQQAAQQAAQRAAQEQRAAKRLKAERKQQAAQQAAQEQRVAKRLKAEREQQATRDKKAAKQFEAERKQQAAQQAAQEKEVAKRVKAEREQQAARDKKAARQLKVEREQHAAQQAAQERKAAKRLKAKALSAIIPTQHTH